MIDGKELHKVILDSNIFIAAAFNKKSSSSKIVEIIKRGHLILVWDEKTKAETKKLITQIPVIEWGQFAQLFTEDTFHDTKVDKSEFKSSISDPDDRKFAALAKSSSAPIVSNDSDLLDTQKHTGIKVYKPRDFLSLVA